MGILPGVVRILKICDFDWPRTPRGGVQSGRFRYGFEDLNEISLMQQTAIKIIAFSRSSRAIKIAKNRKISFGRFFESSKFWPKFLSKEFFFLLQRLNPQIMTYKTWCSDRLGTASSPSSRPIKIWKFENRLRTQHKIKKSAPFEKWKNGENFFPWRNEPKSLKIVGALERELHFPGLIVSNGPNLAEKSFKFFFPWSIYLQKWPKNGVEKMFKKWF